MTTMIPKEKQELLATQQWTDLYFRHNFQDTGQYPTSGSLSASPDIIPAGDKPYSDPTQLISDANWTKDYGSSTNAQQANYIYLRGMNLNTTENRSGRIYLYFSPASLLLWPTDPVDSTKGWSKNPLRTSQGATYVDVKDVAPQGRFVTTDPFQWIPQPIANDHYCLIGRLETPQNPNPIPSPANLTDFAKYISEHPNMAWRNVTTFNPSSPTFTTSVDYDQGQEAGYVYMNLRCINCPDNSLISMNCGTPGPNPPIYYPQTPIKNPKDGSQFTITLYTHIDANWRSNITYTWVQNGTTPLPDMQFVLDPIMPVPDGHALEKYARPLHEFGVNMEMIPQAGPRKGIRLGSCEANGVPATSYAGRGRSLYVAEGRSQIYVVGVSWLERASSVVGSEVAGRDVTITRTPVKDVETETVSLSSDIPDTEVKPAADLVLDLSFDNGNNAGTTQVSLMTTNVPVGAEIWFKNLDGTVPIETAPTRVVTEPNFTISSMVDLTADYSVKMRAYLRLNGTTLPSVWNMKFEAIAIPQTEPEASMPKPIVLVNGGPKPGTLLGRVTVTN